MKMKKRFLATACLLLCVLLQARTLKADMLPPLPPVTDVYVYNGISENRLINDTISRYGIHVQFQKMLAYNLCSFDKPITEWRFEDFPLEHWAARSYQCAIDLGVIEPASSENFNGLQGVTRYEFAGLIDKWLDFLIEKYQIESTPIIDTRFIDIPPGHWMNDIISRVAYFMQYYEGLSLRGGSGLGSYAVSFSFKRMTEYINEHSPVIDHSLSPRGSDPVTNGMVYISTSGDDGFYIDKYEYPNMEGVAPFQYMSYDAARMMCELDGKRLCTAAEWTRACGGPDADKYQTGEIHLGGFCNDYLMKFDKQGIRPAGDMPACTTHEGVVDMAGNAAEWVAERGVMGGHRHSPEQDLACNAMLTPPEAESELDYEYYTARCCADVDASDK